MQPRCSFCGKPQAPDRRLIASGMGEAFICSECTADFHSLLAAERSNRAPAAQVPPPGGGEPAGRRSPAESEPGWIAFIGQQIEEALLALSEREQALIRLRFGLEDGRPRTLEELAQTFETTVEQVRRIEAGLVSRLRGGGPPLPTPPAAG